MKVAVIFYVNHETKQFASEVRKGDAMELTDADRSMKMQGFTCLIYATTLTEAGSEQYRQGLVWTYERRNYTQIKVNTTVVELGVHREKKRKAA